MQCPSCRFENMPGLQTCGRCGTALNLATAAIDVHPPRASKTAKRVRKFVPRSAIYTARDTAAEVGRIVTGSFEDAQVPLPEPPLLARLIVPGWAHIYVGMTLRGRIFLAVYLFLAAMGLLTWGTDMGSLWLGLAMSVHASSALDVLVRQGTMRFPRMVLTSVIVFLVLGAVVYYPAYQVGSHVAAPIRFEEPAGPFERRDVVLVNRWAFMPRNPRRGDVVLFRPLWGARTGAPYVGIHARFVIEENELIDRLVGLPGDRVVWNQGVLTVNGAPVLWAPLFPSKLPAELDITVPVGRYLVFPTTSRVPAPDWNIGLIEPDNIEGGAFLRISPLARFWFIR
jgi:signal peptidase I